MRQVPERFSPSGTSVERAAQGAARRETARNSSSLPQGTAHCTVPTHVPPTHHFFSADLISSSSVPVARLGGLVPPYWILYFPGATQIVGVPTTSISPSCFARSSDSTATSALCRVIVSPGLMARLSGGIGRPRKFQYCVT